MWGLYQHRDLSGALVAVHQVPLDDLEDHSLGTCACWSVVMERCNGIPLVRHNAFDGRQLREYLILGRN